MCVNVSKTGPMGESPIQMAGSQGSPVVDTSRARHQPGTFDTRSYFYPSHEAWEGGDYNSHPAAQRHWIFAWGTPHSRCAASLTPTGIMPPVPRMAHYRSFHPSPTHTQLLLLPLRTQPPSRQLSQAHRAGVGAPLSVTSLDLSGMHLFPCLSLPV